MDSSVSSISNFIEGFGWLYYAFVGIGALFVIAAVQAFRSQYYVAKTNLDICLSNANASSFPTRSTV